MSATLSLPGFPPPPAESLDQWDTPRHTAERIAEFAGIEPGMRVLESSAGLGALAVAARARGADVFCVELDNSRWVHLVRLGFATHQGDFLTSTVGGQDLALMNPPFSEDEEGFDRGLAHVLQALKFAPRVVCHMPLSFISTVDRVERLWLPNTLSRLAIEKRRPKYAGSKQTGQRDMATFEILRGKHDVRQSIEWW